ncbi:MAG TPA: hypothetical protein VFQ88_07730 [Nevskiaceae bacterium]|nr:hypothetical protein [Nevskiaceae bacterium]
MTYTVSTDPLPDVAWAHLYAQGAWHDEAYIVGNRTALTALRDALDAALRTGVGATELYARDGEGYATVCLLRPSLRELALPYTECVAREPTDSTAERPWDIEPEVQQAAIAEACKREGVRTSALADKRPAGDE